MEHRMLGNPRPRKYAEGSRVHNTEESGQVVVPPRRRVNWLSPLPEFPIQRTLSEQLHELYPTQSETPVWTDLSSGKEIETMKTLAVIFNPETQKLESKFKFRNISGRKLIYRISTAHDSFKIPVCFGLIDAEQEITSNIFSALTIFSPNLEELLTERILIYTVPCKPGLTKMADLLSYWKRCVKRKMKIEKVVIQQLFVYRNPTDPAEPADPTDELLTNEVEATDVLTDPSVNVDITEMYLRDRNTQLDMAERMTTYDVAYEEQIAMTNAFNQLMKETQVVTKIPIDSVHRVLVVSIVFCVLLLLYLVFKRTNVFRFVTKYLD